MNYKFKEVGCAELFSRLNRHGNRKGTRSDKISGGDNDNRIVERTIFLFYYFVKQSNCHQSHLAYHMLREQPRLTIMWEEHKDASIIARLQITMWQTTWRDTTCFIICRFKKTNAISQETYDFNNFLTRKSLKFIKIIKTLSINWKLISIVFFCLTLADRYYLDLCFFVPLLSIFKGKIYWITAKNRAT